MFISSLIKNENNEIIADLINQINYKDILNTLIDIIL